jgi:hypothetical protein
MFAVVALVVAPVSTGVTGMVALRLTVTPEVWSTVYFAEAVPAVAPVGPRLFTATD